MRADQIIVEPVLTEKTNAMREGENRKYVFKVHKDANKTMIMGAVNELFSVKPVSCNVLNVKKKPRTSRTKSGYKKGFTTPWKKAVVTLKTGDKIGDVEGS